MDEEITGLLLKYGVKFELVLLQKLAEAYDMDLSILNILTENTDMIAAVIATYTGIYDDDALDLLAKAIREARESMETDRSLLSKNQMMKIGNALNSAGRILAVSKSLGKSLSEMDENALLSQITSNIMVRGMIHAKVLSMIKSK